MQTTYRCRALHSQWPFSKKDCHFQEEFQESDFRLPLGRLSGRTVSRSTLKRFGSPGLRLEKKSQGLLSTNLRMLSEALCATSAPHFIKSRKWGSLQRKRTIRNGIKPIHRWNGYFEADWNG